MIQTKSGAPAPPAPKTRETERSGPIRFEIKAETINDAERTFSGLASTWEVDLGNDVIHLGAFARTLAHWKSSAKVMPLIDLHNYDSVRRVVGKMLAAEEREDGLWCTFQILKADEGEAPDPDADACWRRVKGGYITGLSIGYRGIRYEFEQPEGTSSYWDRIRHLHEVELREVSLVIWGMNTGALIDTTTAKGLGEMAAAIRAGALTDEQKAELRALLDAPPAAPPAPAPEPKGLAPEDAASIAREEMLRDLTLRSLATALR
jgi:HK97 family phage prohead protease